VAGHSGQFTPGGYLSTVKHTALAGIEPTTFRLLVRRDVLPVGLPKTPVKLRRIAISTDINSINCWASNLARIYVTVTVGYWYKHFVRPTSVCDT